MRQTGGPVGSPPIDAGSPIHLIGRECAPVCRATGRRVQEGSVPQAIYHHTFPNGLTLLAEPMEHVRSAAMNFLVPAGCVHDPPE